MIAILARHWLRRRAVVAIASVGERPLACAVNFRGRAPRRRRRGARTSSVPHVGRIHSARVNRPAAQSGVSRPGSTHCPSTKACTGSVHRETGMNAPPRYTSSLERELTARPRPC